LIYHVIDSFSAGIRVTSTALQIPDIVLEEMDKAAQEKK